MRNDHSHRQVKKIGVVIIKYRKCGWYCFWEVTQTELLKIFKVEGDIINQMILPSSLSIPCLAVFIIIIINNSIITLICRSRQWVFSKAARLIDQLPRPLQTQKPSWSSTSSSSLSSQSSFANLNQPFMALPSSVPSPSGLYKLLYPGWEIMENMENTENIERMENMNQMT